MKEELLKQVPPEEVAIRRGVAVDSKTISEAQALIEQVREGGKVALHKIALAFGDLQADESLLVSREELKAAFLSLSDSEQELLQRISARVRKFAVAQREALSNLETSVPGGTAGHKVIPVYRAGCYAPGGRFPLPSSVLMTAVTARAAGVKEVVVASPKPTAVTLGAAYVAGADLFIRAGGAHTIAALAYGVDGLNPCDVIVGPGNRWVTAAKKLVAGDVAIDMLAGPSELLIIVDAEANPEIIAADLLAQAEHDTDAIPILISLDKDLVEKVQIALKNQLETLTTREVAKEALSNGFITVVDSRESACRLSNELAPEHLELLVSEPKEWLEDLTNYGGLFIGSSSAEVFGDYGVGPNHVLPTGGTARYTGGLSVFNFLKINTWLSIENASGLIEDTAQLARLEGLEGHARAAERRK